METEEIRPIIIEQAIHPEGATEDAACFRQAAERIRQLIETLKTHQAELQSIPAACGENPHRNRLQSLLKKCKTYADALEIHAASIETKTVTIQKMIWVGDHQIHPAPSANRADPSKPPDTRPG